MGYIGYGIDTCLQLGFFIHTLLMYTNFLKCILIHICSYVFATYTYIWASPRENLSLGFPSKWGSNQSPQLQRFTRKLKFCLKQDWI